MFYLHTSNKVENLLVHFDAVYQNTVQNNVFEQVLLLIQSEGMGRWITQQMALRNGVFCHYRFVFPNKLFEEIAEMVGCQLLNSQFDRANMVWRIYHLLAKDCYQHYQSLSHYIANDPEGLKRFQLAEQLANIFDQYQIARVQMLFSWQRGQTWYDGTIYNDVEQWQQQLWGELLSEITHGQLTRSERWHDAIKQIEQCDTIPGLPKQLSVFGINSLPGVYIQLLEALSSKIDVHLYLLNPCRQYWLDLPSKKQIVLDNIAKTPEAEKDLLQLNNPLLASYGKQGQYFQELLLVEDKLFQSHFESFAFAEDGHNLHCLQNDMLENTLSAEKVNSIDDSICIHNCHTPLRELEVLKNQILHAIDTQGYALRDFVIMAPDIAAYAPYIPSVFDDLKHAIADESLKNSNQLVSAFDQFLQVVTGRFGWQEVLDLLALDEIYPAFELSEADLVYIHHWIEQTNIRWGYSGEHKKALDLPVDQMNTWLAGLQRMFYGYAIGDDSAFVDGILPYIEIEGSQVAILGKLYHYLQLLWQAKQCFSQPRSLSQWAEVFCDYINQLFKDDNNLANEKVALTDLFTKLVQQQDQNQEMVPFPVIYHWFVTQSGESSSAKGFLSGGLTFCSLLPMRSIPFKVIALLGMNEGEFPAKDPKIAFDLMQVQFYKGDRSKRLDDKYQFMEAILSARDALWIFYCGQSPETNEVVQPASVVCDLVDVLVQNYGLDRGQLIHQHPLQRYHSRYFTESQRSVCVNYNEQDFQVAQGLYQRYNELVTPDQNKGWSGEFSLPIEWPSHITVADLIRFVKNPQRYFLKQVMQVDLQTLEADLPEHEPFTLQPLERYQIKDLILNQLLDNEGLWSEQQNRRLYETLQAQGRLPLGQVGLRHYEELFDDAWQYYQGINNIQPMIGDVTADVKIDYDCQVDNHLLHIEGELSNQFETGMCLYRLGDLDGKTLLSTWLQHLLLNQVVTKSTYLIYGQASELKYCCFKPEDISCSPLSEWLACFLKGLEKPGPLIPEVAFAYVKQQFAKTNRNSLTPEQKAMAAFEQALQKQHKPELGLLYGNMDDNKQDALLEAMIDRFIKVMIEPVYEVMNARQTAI